MLVTTVLLLALAFVILGSYLHLYHFYFWQYLFFCRFPLLITFFLAVLLPLMLTGSFIGGNMIGNLAVLGPWEVAAVSFLAVTIAWAIMFVLARLLVWIAYRARLGFYRDTSPVPGHKRAIWSGFTRRLVGCATFVYETTIIEFPETEKTNRKRAFLYLPLALPLISVVVWRSTATAAAADIGFLAKDVLSLALNIGAALTGLLAAVAVRVGSPYLVRRRKRAQQKVQKARKAHNGWLGAAQSLQERAENAVVPKDVERKETEGAARKFSQEEVVARARQGIWFFGVICVVYVAGYLLLSPTNLEGGPALIPILLLLMLLTFTMTPIAGWLDISRIGVIVTLLVCVFGAYHIFNIDHFYDVRQIPSEYVPESSCLTPHKVLERWTAHRDGERCPLVVVTASGGGITASRWTAEVLAQIQEAIPKFGDSIILVSTTSGGGVAAMYFVNAYTQGRAPASNVELAAVKEKSGASSLLATAWGIAYLDFWSFAPPVSKRDRGWMLERTWARLLDDDDDDRDNDCPTTLLSWQKDVLSDWRPIQVFNATVAETGERFLLSPMQLTNEHDLDRDPCDIDAAKSAGWDALNFLDLYPESDIEVVTAARLSATFPFVSPIARPAEGSVSECIAYHLADGGYYDNHGVATAVDFLRTVLPSYYRSNANADRRPPVIIVQIRAGKAERRRPHSRQGFSFATIGPLTTLTGVRQTSQVNRNDVAIALLREAWHDRVKIETLVFDLGNVDAPLSWHLTREDEAAIEQAWSTDHDCCLKLLRSAFSGDSPAHFSPKEGGEALICAVQQNRVLTIDELLDHGADPNITADILVETYDEQLPFTPLCLSAHKGYAHISEALLAAGAELSAKCAYGQTPLEIARERGHERLVRLFESAELSKK